MYRNVSYSMYTGKDELIANACLCRIDNGKYYIEVSLISTLDNHAIIILSYTFMDEWI